MSIINILMVGVPEVGLNVLFMLYLLDIKKFNVFKIVCSIIGILVGINISRDIFDGLTISIASNTIAYIIVMWAIWKVNLRQSIIVSSLSVFIIVLSEILTVAPVVSYIVERILQFEFLSAVFIWSLPTRIIQILIILTICKKIVNLNNYILINKRWSKLSLSQRITTILSVLFIFTSTIFSMNYSEFYMKMKINNIDISIFSSSMQLLLLQSVVYLILTLILLKRTSDYENFKTILNLSQDELMEFLERGEKNEKA